MNVQYIHVHIHVLLMKKCNMCLLQIKTDIAPIRVGTQVLASESGTLISQTTDKFNPLARASKKKNIYLTLHFLNKCQYMYMP